MDLMQTETQTWLSRYAEKTCMPLPRRGFSYNASIPHFQIAFLLNAVTKHFPSHTHTGSSQLIRCPPIKKTHCQHSHGEVLSVLSTHWNQQLALRTDTPLPPLVRPSSGEGLDWCVYSKIPLFTCTADSWVFSLRWKQASCLIWYWEAWWNGAKLISFSCCSITKWK